MSTDRIGHYLLLEEVGSGGQATTFTVDSDETVGDYTSVAIGADGLGLISYIGDGPDGNGDLKVLHCGNVLCSP